MEFGQLNLFEFTSPINNSVYVAFPNNEFSELEYKSASEGFPQSFWPTYSSFANTNGGFIILGIVEKKGYINIEGLSERQIQTLQSSFWDQVNNKNKTNSNIMSNEDVKEIAVEGKNVLVFRVPSASRTEKPIYLNGNPFGNTYKRNHEGDYKCTDDQVRRMIADADTSYHPDARILEGFTMEDIDANSLRRYRQLLAIAKPNHVWLSYDDSEFLRRIRAYRQDRATGKEGFTVAGILMFGKGTSIIEQECTPSFFPDFRENLSTDIKDRWTDRIFPDGTWESNLLQFYLRVWPKLTSGLPKPFKLEAGVRKDETPAHVALREAFVNTLVHADYTASGSLIIEQKIDGFKFSNPGTLLVSLEQYYQGGISECRNTILSNMFMLIGSAEKAGSGVDKIMQGWESSHWRRPYLNIEERPDRVQLELPMFSMIGQNTLDELHILFGNSIDTLSTDEITILALCHVEGDVTNGRLQYMISQHRTDITRMLQDLCKQGFLLPENKGRWSSYHLNNQYLTKGKEVYDNTINLEDNIDTYRDNIDTSDKNNRLPNKKIQELIMDFCMLEYKTSDSISKEINRNKVYVQSVILPKLIKSGKLMRRFPDKPNHPIQAYKTVINTD
jgi:ATP-dependent DNA helicase RecG